MSQLDEKPPLDEKLIASLYLDASGKAKEEVAEHIKACGITTTKGLEKSNFKELLLRGANDDDRANKEYVRVHFFKKADSLNEAEAAKLTRARKDCVRVDTRLGHVMRDIVRVAFPEEAE
jgi:hypothetical protein